MSNFITCAKSTMQAAKYHISSSSGSRTTGSVMWIRYGVILVKNMCLLTQAKQLQWTSQRWKTWYINGNYDAKVYNSDLNKQHIWYYVISPYAGRGHIWLF